MAPAPTEPELSTAVQAPRQRRWLRWLAALGALAALALAVDWLLTPGPGTLLLQEVRPSRFLAPAVSVAVMRDQPVLLRFPSRNTADLLSVRRLAGGVALPLPVSTPAWEWPPLEVGDHNFVVADDRLFVVEVAIGRYLANTGVRSPDGGRDCLSVVPLAGGPALRRCHSPSLDVWSIVPVDAVDRDVYYAGYWQDHDAVALAVAAGDGTWRRLDVVSHAHNDTDNVGNIVHDRDAIYWSTRAQVRRVDRNSGRVRTVFHVDLPTGREIGDELAPHLTMVGRTLVVASYSSLSPDDSVRPVYALDPNREARASTTEPFAKLKFTPYQSTTDGVALYGAGSRRIWRLDLDGHAQALASVDSGFKLADLAVAGDRVIYVAGSFPGLLQAPNDVSATTADHLGDTQVEPRTYKVWSVPK